MATYSDFEQQKVDYLFKKVGSGVAKTDTPSNKSPGNEAEASPFLLRADKLWTQADEIPSTPDAVTGVVAAHVVDGTVVRCAVDTTSATNRTWLCEDSGGGSLRDWIPPEFKSGVVTTGYHVRVYADTATASDVVTNGVELFPGTSDQQWFFDYQAGILHFIGDDLPTGLNSTNNTIYVAGYRYIGLLGEGLDSISTLSDTTIGTTADNNILAYDSGSGRWTNQTAADAGLFDGSNLEDLSNVTITGPLAALDVIQWSGTAWVDRTLSQAGIASTGSLGSYVAIAGSTMTGKLEIDVADASGAVVSTPHIFHTDSFKYTDTATANAGTNSTELKHTVFSVPTAATNKDGITVTTASTVKIEGAVASDGGKVAFGTTGDNSFERDNNYALWVDDGLTKLDGGIESSKLSSIGTSNLQLISAADVLVKLNHDNDGTGNVFAVRANAVGSNVFTVGETGVITGTSLDLLGGGAAGVLKNTATDGYIEIQSDDEFGVAIESALNLGAYETGAVNDHSWIVAAHFTTETGGSARHRRLRLLSRSSEAGGHPDVEIWARRNPDADEPVWDGEVDPASILLVNEVGSNHAADSGVRLKSPVWGDPASDASLLKEIVTIVLPPNRGADGDFLKIDSGGGSTAMKTAWSGLGDVHHDQYLRHDTWVQSPTEAAGSCKMCSTTNIAGTYEYDTDAGRPGWLTADSNGEMADIDGTTAAETNRLLLVGQTNAEENGVYTISDKGSASTPYVLKRIGALDEPDDFENTFVVVRRGTSNSGVWACTNEGDADIGQSSPGGAVGPVYKKAYSSTHLVNHVSGPGRLLGLPTTVVDGGVSGGELATDGSDGGAVVQEITYATLATDLVMSGATVSVDGAAGTVPKPLTASNDDEKFLRGNGTWAVPTDTTYALATVDVLGLIKLVSNTTQAVSAETLSVTAERTYAVQVNSSGQAVVNVPWTGGSGGGISWDGTTADGVATYSSGDANAEAELRFDGAKTTLMIGPNAPAFHIAGTTIDEDELRFVVMSDSTSKDTMAVERGGRITTSSGIRAFGNSFIMGPRGSLANEGSPIAANVTDGTNSPKRKTVNFISNEGVATQINKAGGYAAGITEFVVDDAEGIGPDQSITLKSREGTDTENHIVDSVDYTTNTVTIKSGTGLGPTTNAYADNDYVDVWGTSSLVFRNANDNSDLQFDYAETGGVLKFRSRTSKQHASHLAGDWSGDPQPSGVNTTRFEIAGDGAAKFNTALTHPCTPTTYPGTATLSSTDRVVWVDPSASDKVITLPAWDHGRVIDIYYGKTDGTTPFTVTPYLDETTEVTGVGYAGDALNGTQRVEQIPAVAEVSRLTLGDPSLLTAGEFGYGPSSDFYLIRDGNSGGPGKKYIWLKVSDDGMGWSTDPLGLVNSVQSGHLSDDGVEVEVDLTTVTTAGQLASAIATAVNGYASFAAVVENTNEVKITNETAGGASPNIRMRAGQSSETMADPSYTGYDETVDTAGSNSVGSTTTTPTVTITAPVGSGVRFVAIRREGGGGAGGSDMNIWAASVITGATVST